VQRLTHSHQDDVERVIEHFSRCGKYSHLPGNFSGGQISR